MAKRVALLIGNQTFRSDSGLSPLRGPANDLRAVARVLSDPDRGRFEVKEFHDEPSHTVLPAIEEALSAAAPDDLFLIYYSGHGKLDRNGRLCLATANTRRPALLSTSIPARNLRDLVEHSDCDQIVLLLDCCYSGAVGVKGDVESELRVVEDARGFYIMTASSHMQSAREEEPAGGAGVMGRFTAALVSGIESGAADRGHKGWILLSDLRHYLQQVVTGQTPKFFDRNASGDPLISHCPAVTVVASELYRKGVRLGELGSNEDAIAIYGELIRRFASDPAVEVRQLVAMALINKGIMLSGIYRHEDAIVTFDDALGRFGDASELSLREQVALTLLNKAETFFALRRSEEEVKVYDDLVTRFDDATELPLRERIAIALNRKGNQLSRMGRLEQGHASFDEVVNRFGGSAELPLREQVIRALRDKAHYFYMLGRNEEAIAVYDELLARFVDTADSAVVSDTVADSLGNKATLLTRLGRQEEAIDVLDDLIARFGSEDFPQLRGYVRDATADRDRLRKS